MIEPDAFSFLLIPIHELKATQSRTEMVSENLPMPRSQTVLGKVLKKSVALRRFHLHEPRR
ncbi:hypothetical protein Q3C01_08390 [Bradyrhizobium sp. UFLA05-109]